MTDRARTGARNREQRRVTTRTGWARCALLALALTLASGNGEARQNTSVPTNSSVTVTADGRTSTVDTNRTLETVYTARRSQYTITAADTHLGQGAGQATSYAGEALSGSTVNVASSVPERKGRTGTEVAARTRTAVLDADKRRQIQRALARGGFDPGPADGNFRPRTRRAIRAWQDANGYPSTGSLSEEQVEKMLSGAARNSRTAVLDADKRRQIQRALARGGFDPGPADGNFRPRTRRAIRAWQHANGYPDTGSLSEEQVEKMLSRAASNTRTAVLDGDKRRRIQQALSLGGFDPGPVDGKFGPRTRRAIRAWQHANGYPGTGSLSEKQVEKMLSWAASNAKPQAGSGAGELYGSITFSQEDEGGYAWGIAWRFGSSVSATDEALEQCRLEGGTECAEVGWFQNACGALAIGDENGYGAGWGRTKRQAERDALRRCRADNANCRLEVARCSRSEQAAGAAEMATESEPADAADSGCDLWLARARLTTSRGAA